MKHLLNTLFVTSENVYLTLDGENVVARNDDQMLARYPLHTLSGIISFAYPGASPALMGACADRGISLAFCSPRGRFLARVNGKNNGNVMLRRTQYRIADQEDQSCRIARCMIFGKLYNARWSIERMRRDHGMRADADKLALASQSIKNILPAVENETSFASLRGLEGTASSTYFSVLDDMILVNKDIFFYHGRSRRPPMDAFNALLSFAYSILANDCASALESVGLDAYVGFFHQDRPGRCSLALDLMEEFRPCYADRFVLTLINNRMIKPDHFICHDNGGILLTDEGRKSFLKNWQEKKKEVITHPFLKEKLPWGLVPYMQALLLARYLRQDLDDYPPFLWK